MHKAGGITPRRGSSVRHGKNIDVSAHVRRSPSGRTPQWVLEEAQEHQRQAGMSPRQRRRKQRRAARIARQSASRWSKDVKRRNRAWRASPAIGIVLLAALWVTPDLFNQYALPVIHPYLPNASAPPPGVDASRDPIGVPPAVADIGGYRFMESPDPEQEMVAYDPCRPVRVVVRPDDAPPGGEQLIEEAIGAISAATGLQFVDAGTTTEAPSSRREPYQPDRYGRQWAPILIAWSDAEEHPDLAGDVAGRGGSTARNVDAGPFVYVTGQVVLDAPSLTSMMERPDQVRAVIMHELAHVVGLDHVDDPGQLMYGDNVGLTDFAPGDRAGLAKLGAGTCVPRL
ncbi:matrixin family metalloprotease [Kocuria sp. NPDC057446]|uniref:matrixin family metalloprotease n=1 Tax=Kocuria sp. NPDC057446 TaxID=3346137 RepID=UPI0036947918